MDSRHVGMLAGSPSPWGGHNRVSWAPGFPSPCLEGEGREVVLYKLSLCHLTSTAALGPSLSLDAQAVAGPQQEHSRVPCRRLGGTGEACGGTR